MSNVLGDAAYCVEYFYAKPGCCEKLIESLLRLAELTRAEVGCLQYDLLQDTNNPNLIILLVKFTDKQAMSNHEQQPFITQFVKTEMAEYCEKLIWNDAHEIIPHQ